MPQEKFPDELTYLRKEVRRLRAALDALSPSIDALLQRRGFQIYKKEPAEDLLLPQKKFRDEYYRMLYKYSFRLFLRDVIKHQDMFTLKDVTRYATAGVTEEYLEYLSSIGLVRRKRGVFGLRSHIRSFGETLEWYVAEVLKREFGIEAVWGVKFRRPGVGGDYDVLAKFDSSILYIEVKSSPPKQIYDNEIIAFLERVSDLSPEIAVFMMDTELRMKDKIVPMFEDAVMKKPAQEAGIMRMEKELFQIGDRIFIINAKDSIVANIGAVFQWHFRR